MDEDAALGFRRLSIIDLSSVGDQPLYNEDRSMVLVFNGEIYNYQDLRSDLVEAGHIFVSNTDSETLLHGYEAVSYTHLGHWCNLNGAGGYLQSGALTERYVFI